MSGLISSGGLLNPVLRGIVLAAHNPLERAFFRKAINMIEVDAETGRIMSVGQATGSSIMGRESAISQLAVSQDGGYGRSRSTLTAATLYTLLPFAHGVPVSNTTRKNAAAAGADADQIAAATGLQKIITALDTEVFSQITGTTAIAASGNWGSSSVDPGVDVDGAVRAIEASIGAVDRANITVGISQQVWHLASRNARYRGALTSDGENPRRLVRLDAFAKELDVGKVVVCDTYRNTAVEGATNSGSSTATNAGYVGVYFDAPVNEGAGLVQPPAFALVMRRGGLQLYEHQIDALRREQVWFGEADVITINATSGRTLTGTTA